MFLNFNFASKILGWLAFLIFAFSAVMLLVFAHPADAQPEATIFDAYSGAEFALDSADLDVGYVPTPIDIVNRILKLGSVGPNDFLIDLGSGDGRIIITAAQKFGAHGLGVDLNAKLVELSKKYAIKEGVAKQTRFIVQDIFKTDISKADVLTMYLLPEVNLKLRPKLLKELKPGTRIVSYNYHLGEWRPDQTIFIEKITLDDDAILYLWTVPVKIAGNWQWHIELQGEMQDFYLRLDQKYQDINGMVWNRGQKWIIFNSAVLGYRISFSLVSEFQGRMIRQDYTGTVKGDVIAGTVKLSGAITERHMPWQAFRCKDRVKLQKPKN